MGMGWVGMGWVGMLRLGGMVMTGDGRSWMVCDWGPGAASGHCHHVAACVRGGERRYEFEKA